MIKSKCLLMIGGIGQWPNPVERAVHGYNSLLSVWTLSWSRSVFVVVISFESLLYFLSCRSWPFVGTIATNLCHNLRFLVIHSTNRHQSALFKITSGWFANLLDVKRSHISLTITGLSPTALLGGSSDEKTVHVFNPKEKTQSFSGREIGTKRFHVNNNITFKIFYFAVQESIFSRCFSELVTIADSGYRNFCH